MKSWFHRLVLISVYLALLYILYRNRAIRHDKDYNNPPFPCTHGKGIVDHGKSSPSSWVLNCIHF